MEEKVINFPVWDRIKISQLMEELNNSNKSIRNFSKENNVPRSTIQGWHYQKNNINAPSALVDFLESEDGINFLHRLFIALIFCFHELGGSSIAVMSRFLELTELNKFIAGSESSLKKSVKLIEELIIEFGKKEEKRLSCNMAEKKISIALDETFKPQVCLVAIEPDSNYILLEKFEENRKAETWHKSLDERLRNLPVKAIQCTSDEGRSLVKYVTEILGTHHSPDLFHVQQELTKGAAAQLRLASKRSAEELDQIACKKEKLKRKQNKKNSTNLDLKINNIKKQELEILEKHRININNEKVFKENRKKISEIYHPYDLEYGTVQTPESMETELKHVFENICTATENLSDRCKKHISKAAKMLDEMKTTMQFFFTTIAVMLDNMNCDWKTRGLVEDALIPGFYLEYVAQKETYKKRKEDIMLVSEELLSDFKNKHGPFAQYSDKQLKEMAEIAKEATIIFQRSSSCVEGRNGVLSLCYHNFHLLSQRKLSALTIIHNFYIKTKFDKTPAERFFGKKEDDLFEYLINKCPLQGRPRKRKKAA